MRYFTCGILFILSSLSFAQNYSLKGQVFGDDGTPVVYSSVVLLNPSDSIMEAFGITNKSGNYEIKSIKKGDYLLQVSYLGYETYYRKITIPVHENKLDAVVLKTKNHNLDEVKVTGEYIPLSIKKDTIEYNANAFNLSPDDVTEDLLKKLPGVEVDREGNIKAMGENVNKVFVDGKEFFGNDPKVATKNVPADAIDKVQVYDRKSEGAMFTGIDDGSRQKTINLKLKEDKKNALFGDVMAGAGTGEHWQGSAKMYRFTDKLQVAALGMANNINQFGFSINDYMNFNGGIGQMLQGGNSGQISMKANGDLPINSGNAISGLTTSGAAGANFSISKNQYNRSFLSYLGSGTKKVLEETTKSWNYQKNSEYYQNKQLDESKKNQNHSFNFGTRKRIGSTQNILIDGNFSIGNGNNIRSSFSESTSDQILVNTLLNQTLINNERLSGIANGSYTKILNNAKSNISVGSSFSISTSISENDIATETNYSTQNLLTQRNIFQDNTNESLNYSLYTTFTRILKKGFYITPGLRYGRSIESLLRTERNLALFPNYPENDFRKDYNWFRPEINLKKIKNNKTISLTLQVETGRLKNTLNENSVADKNYVYFTPAIRYENEFKTGQRLVLAYRSFVNTPNVDQLLPVRNEVNPLSIFYGNPNLKPQYSHSLISQYILFDQFSFTMLMANIIASYTNNTINSDRTIDENLAMVNTLKNFDYSYNIRGNIDFSTPIRKLGLKINLILTENWNKGLNLINGVENANTNMRHKASFRIDNRKKVKWDVNTGIAVTITNSEYSIQTELNNTFFDLSWFADAEYKPSESWSFEVNADITNYTDKSFDKELNVPLLGAEISYLFLKNKRGTLQLKGIDLLNKNQLVKRFGEQNYLREIRSNSIGRFVMLSFTYRLNKFGSKA